MENIIPQMTQPDEALRLLAQMYARWCMHTTAQGTLEEAYRAIRDLLYQAASQQEAYEQLVHHVEGMSDLHNRFATWVLARDMVREVMEAGGSIEALVIGQTDGFRHLCWECCQNEQNFQRVRFFNEQERRLLLKPEITGERRSAYALCQLCRQPLSPLKLVIFVRAGTIKHSKPCSCQQCNRIGMASLLNIYACEKDTQQILLPGLLQIVAPSAQQCIEQAIKMCREYGWYMLNKNTVSGEA